MSEEEPQPLKVPDHILNAAEAQAPPAAVHGEIGLPPPAPPRREGNQVFGGQTIPQIAHAQHTHKLDEEIPFETVPLPSKGVIYPPDSPLHMLPSLDIKVMTAREEDILTSRALIKKGTVITELLKSCLMDKTIHVGDMIAGDRNALMVAVRITGYGSDYPVEIDCGECGFKHKHEFTLGGLPIKTLDIEPVEPGMNVFRFELPISQRTVYFKYLTGTDEEEIDVLHERLRKTGQVQDAAITTRLKYSILQVDDVKDKSVLARFVDRMRAGDSRALRKYMDDNAPGIEMREQVTCPACAFEEVVTVPIGVTFFWPE